jgi:hypothetical protein
MSETSSLLPESEGRRTLRDRIVDAFRSPQNGLGISTNPNNTAQRSTQSRTVTGNSSGPDVRTRLLQSYHSADPACGERRCSHGTFSPRLEDGRQYYIGESGDGFGYNGHGGTGGAASGPRGIDDHPESRPGSETPSQMKSSLTTLSMNDTKKQYGGFQVIASTFYPNWH